MNLMRTEKLSKLMALSTTVMTAAERILTIFDVVSLKLKPYTLWRFFYRLGIGTRARKSSMFCANSMFAWNGPASMRPISTWPPRWTALWLNVRRPTRKTNPIQTPYRTPALSVGDRTNRKVSTVIEMTWLRFALFNFVSSPKSRSSWRS